MTQQEVFKTLAQFQGSAIEYSRGQITDTAEVLASKHGGNVPVDVFAEVLMRITPAAMIDGAKEWVRHAR